MGEPASPEDERLVGEVQGLASRVAAYRAVRRVHSTGAWSPRAVDSALRGGGRALDARDRAFAANLAYETLRWEGTLDWALARVLTRPLGAVQPEVLDVLRLGAWQLLRGGTPDRSAVGTCVDLARAEIGPQTTGFVNGVLRGLGREKERLPWPPEDSDEGLGLALGYPAWVVGEARATFGDRAPAVLAAGNDAPGLTLRAVPAAGTAGRTGAGQRATRDALVEELCAQGLNAQPGATADAAVRVPGGDPSSIAAVSEGRAAPQDEASMLVVQALAAATGAARGAAGQRPEQARTGESGLADARVLDACAAPGGKSAHLAGLGAEVVAMDLRHARARLVAEAADRLGVNHLGRGGLAVVAADATAPPLRDGAFDAVLLDAPCSGLGVVRRRPELRWNREASDPARLGELQTRLLESAVPLLRPGGVLLYSVCTWTLAETRDVVSALLAAEGDRLTVIDVSEGLGGAGVPVPGSPGRLLTPDQDGVDGMFVCAFARTIDRDGPP